MLGLFLGSEIGVSVADELGRSTKTTNISTYFLSQIKFTYDVSQLIQWAYDNEYELTFGEAWRSKETQYLYSEQGKTKTINSKHQERLAIDLNLSINGKYTDDPEDYRGLGEYWESLNSANIWGGRFGVKEVNYNKEIGWDAGHFERTY